MGLLNWLRTPPEPTTRDVLNRLRDLEAAMRTLQLEWEATFDKVTAAVARTRKRERDAEKAAAGTPPTGDASDLGVPTRPSKAELRARAGLFGNGVHGGL